MRPYTTSVVLPKPQCIWLFIDSQAVGGIETHVANLALALAKRDHSVSVVFWQSYQVQHPMIELLNQHHIAWVMLDGSIGSIMHAMNDYPPCLIHSHGYKASIISRMLRLIKPLKLVSSFHAGEISKGRMALYDFIDRYSALLSHKRVAISTDIANRIGAPSKVIDNFIDVPASAVCQLSKREKPTIAFVGRLTAVKGPDRFYQLAKRLPQFDFVVFGEGEMRPKEDVLALNNLVFHGQKNSMELHWRNIDLLCMPSRNEGLPMAALEAMGRGIPVIATNVGGLSRLIEHQVNGFLFSGFNLDCWQACIVDWHQDRSMQAAIARQAKRTIKQRFSADAVLPQFELLYQQLI
ncbi:glycosyltransferase family 4 protein [Agarivorans sp. TSD2052]|uniref:glycosyltransferase family 4 protein n=1 Tax=Agarivorans sp. TSD2052 TaxID=2937286 RepID=UPI00200C5E65|nr:glycosyltransferase family 4 protein [Agarivorans sp. TSD2052]UPW16986.1 glycosyltransferase family 4 protein [Agarivorans sp. TSD2052]